MQVPILARSSREMSQTVRIGSTFSLRKNVHTMLLPQKYFCYLVLNLVAKVCYHQMKLISRPADVRVRVSCRVRIRVRVSFTVRVSFRVIQLLAILSCNCVAPMRIAMWNVLGQIIIIIIIPLLLCRAIRAQHRDT